MAVTFGTANVMDGEKKLGTLTSLGNYHLAEGPTKDVVLAFLAPLGATEDTIDWGRTGKHNGAYLLGHCGVYRSKT